MSIIITPGHTEITESEFIGRHPDTFSTVLAAATVKEIAGLTDLSHFPTWLGSLWYGEYINTLEQLRADIHMQVVALDEISGITPIRITVGGQVNTPMELAGKEYLDSLVRNEAAKLLENAGYFSEHYSPAHIEVDTRGIGSQSPNLNCTTRNGKFGDNCVVYGHYISEPFGIDGTFSSLVIGKQIDNTIDNLVRSGTVPDLRPDGKVTVTVVYDTGGFLVKDITLSVAHRRNPNPEYKVVVKDEVRKVISRYRGGENASINVNQGGDFDVYFLKADYGTSGKKDHVIITGGKHNLGTDGVWGKCLHKSSSIAIPYAFALSRPVCDITKANFASVRVNPRYGGPEERLKTQIGLEEIDSRYEHLRGTLDKAFETLQLNPFDIRHILKLGDYFSAYALFNDVRNFHNPNQPWKKVNTAVESQLLAALERPL